MFLTIQICVQNFIFFFPVLNKICVNAFTFCYVTKENYRYK